jgi:hypothetical protein
LRNLKAGHSIALTSGEFQISETESSDVKRLAAILVVSPSAGSEISYEGEYGFSCMKVAEPEAEA